MSAPNQLNPELRRGRALILVGPHGCGKSTLARKLAVKHGGNVVEVSADQLESEFAIGAVLDGEPRTVIVEGLPARESVMYRIKSMLTHDVVRIQRKNRPSRLVKTPNLIFCTSELDPLAVLGYERRFLVVPMKAAEEQANG